MPANPDHIQRREVLSEDYHDEKVTIDFYTNSAIAIYRGDEDDPEGRVWMDNLEKRGLLAVLHDELTTDDNPYVVGPSPYDEETLRELYHEEGLTLVEVAGRLDRSKSTIASWMDDFGIEREQGPRVGVEDLQR